MFENLTKNLGKIFNNLRNKGTISEQDLDITLREIRIALLEADVSLKFIKEFLANIREKSLGQGVVKSISPGQMIIKIINDELVSFLSSEPEESKLNLKSTPPACILMSGLQGSGKTTTSSKLALHLKNQGKKVFLVSLDIYRPAAREQLNLNAGKIGVECLDIVKEESIDQIINRAKQEYKKGSYDVVIYDTAGRLHIDEELIEELKHIKTSVNPSETLLVLDAMTGQDAVLVADKFNKATGITGVILTRIDGDSRGGAALSVKYITGAPIKFVGTGEKSEALEIFYPDRIASRILGMGDIVSLVEKAIETADVDEMEKLTKRMEAGKFNLNDYASQLKNIQKLGGISSIMGMIPGMGKLMDTVSPDKLNSNPVKKQLAAISSMTKKERRDPSILNASRKVRISKGSGVDVHEINKLIKQYTQISKMLKKARNMDPKALMRSLKGMM
jgi:signal recognition particle subunit SRP54